MHFPTQYYSSTCKKMKEDLTSSQEAFNAVSLKILMRKPQQTSANPKMQKILSYLTPVNPKTHRNQQRIHNPQIKVDLKTQRIHNHREQICWKPLSHILMKKSTMTQTPSKKATHSKTSFVTNNLLVSGRTQ